MYPLAVPSLIDLVGMPQSSQIESAVSRVMESMENKSPLIESQVRADVMLEIKHAGKYVVYTDVLRDGKLQRVIHVATTSLREANDKINSLPDELRSAVNLTAVDEKSRVAVGLHEVG